MLVTAGTNSRILFTMPILFTPRESSTMIHGLRRGGGEEGRGGEEEVGRGGGEEEVGRGGEEGRGWYIITVSLVITV